MAPAQDPVTVVEDDGLPRRGTADRFAQPDVQLVPDRLGGGRDRPPVRADLGRARHRALMRPDRHVRDQIADVECLGRANRHRGGHRGDVEDITRPAVGRGTAKAQAPALPDRERERPVVLPHPLAGDGVHHRTGPRPQPVAQPPAGVAVGDEADVMAVRLVRDRETAAGGLGPDLGLRGVPQREDRVHELFGTQRPQHVGLVLVRIHRTAQHRAGQLGVMPGDDRVEAQRQRPVEHRRELDPLIAADAGVRRPPG